MQQKNYVGLNPAGFHNLAYTQWGTEHASTNNTVVCVHGLTRNSRDFDLLATDLMRDFRVVCPDVVGRGKSDWLPKDQPYGFPQYLADMNALIARLDVKQVDWVGTSMGGLIGMIMAAQPNTPIRRLVMNDVGPMIPLAGTQRIMQYIAAYPKFDSLADGEKYLRKIFAPFGTLTNDQWHHIAHYSFVRNDHGQFKLVYDPRIISGLTATSSPFSLFVKIIKLKAQQIFHRLKEGRHSPFPLSEMWEYWEKVKCPVLLMRGETSDILLPETVQRMQQTHPQLQVVEFKGCGHAPALMAEEQISAIHSWLIN